MSYILDAVRKAEQERQKQQEPELLRLQPSAIGIKPPSRPYYKVTLISCSLLFVVANGLVWRWYASNDDTSVDIQHNQVAAALPNKTSTAELPVNTSAVVKVKSQPAAASPEKSAELPTVALWQAPSNVKSAISSLDFSFHVYSSNPERRTIIINKVRLREGSQIGADLLLHAINEQGVVIRHGNLLIEVSVLEQW